MTIYTPGQTALILSAMSDVEAGNNGWAYVPGHRWLLSALQTAGYTVMASRDWHGNPGAYKAYTPKAQASLRQETWAESNYNPSPLRSDEPDYEAAILDRQERETMDY